jgi:hypothetical protein
MDKGRIRDFLKKPSVKKAGELLKLSKKPAKNNDRVANRILSFNRTFILTGVGKQSRV